VAGMIDAPNGNARIGSHHAVDERQSRLNLIDKQFALRFIVGPGAGAQPKLAVVGDADGIGHIPRPKYAGYWSEQLIFKRRRAFRNVRHNRRLKEISLAV